MSKIPALRNLHSKEERQIIKDIRNRYTVRALEDKAGKSTRSMFGGFASWHRGSWERLTELRFEKRLGVRFRREGFKAEGTASTMTLKWRPACSRENKGLWGWNIVSKRIASDGIRERMCVVQMGGPCNTVGLELLLHVEWEAVSHF